MGEHRNVDELVARVTNQAIEIERMLGELRSVKNERDHWIEVCADLSGKLNAARGDVIQKIGVMTRVSPPLESKAEVVHEGFELIDPYAHERRPRWAWWRRVLGGA